VKIPAAAVTAAVLLLAACGEEGGGVGGSGGGVGTGDPVAEARTVYRHRCQHCHGSGGAGDGKTARMMGSDPRDFTDPQWQATISDEGIATIIVEGGQAVGKQPLMPASPGLRTKPETLDALVALIRDFGAGEE